MTPSFKNIYKFRKYVEDTTCVQKLKFVLTLKRKKTSVFRKNTKKAVYDDVIFIFDISSQRFFGFIKI